MELQDAIAEGNVREVRKLIDNGADVNIKNSDGAAPLISAIIFGHTKIVRILLDNGADVNTTINFNQFEDFSPLIMAIDTLGHILMHNVVLMFLIFEL